MVELNKVMEFCQKNVKNLSFKVFTYIREGRVSSFIHLEEHFYIILMHSINNNNNNGIMYTFILHFFM